MKWLISLFAAIQCIILPSAVLAQVGPASRTVLVESWEEEWDPATQSWVRVTAVQSHSPSGSKHQTPRAARFSVPTTPTPAPRAIARYGPFQVTGPNRAAMIGPTTPSSPHHFRAMLRDFPQLTVLDFVDAPGTNDDIANLQVGRMIRAAGIATHVPRHGSVRSGAVELFLAGAKRTMDDGARFAVHSWLDHLGREPKDFAPDAPENRLYLDYYAEMGMSERRAAEFYAMTNSVPHHSAKWLDSVEMRGWLREAPQLRMPTIVEPKALPAPVPALHELRFLRAAPPRMVQFGFPQVETPSFNSETAEPAVALAPALAYSDMSAIGLSLLDS